MHHCSHWTGIINKIRDPSYNIHEVYLIVQPAVRSTG